jgi:hypothetical protein
VVDDDVVRPDLLEDVVHRLGPAHRIPQQVGAAILGLQPQGRHHAAPGGREEPPQRVAGRPDHAGVGGSAQGQVGPLEAERGDDRVRGRPGRHHHPLAGVAPRRGQGGQRQQV